MLPGSVLFSEGRQRECGSGGEGRCGWGDTGRKERKGKLRLGCTR